MLTIALLALTQANLFPSTNKIPLAAPEKKSFDFVVLGDNRPVGSGLPATDVFREILKEVDWIHPAFVLSSGDLVYGNEEPMDVYRHELDEIQNLLGKLHEPFFNAPGNHEINQREDFQKEYTSRFGPMFGEFTYDGWRFIALSTDQADASASVSQAEFSFLDQSFKTSAPTCVFMHRPVFGRDGVTEEGKVVMQANRLHDLFKAHDVKAVFQGHDHVFNHQTHDGIEYFISGGAGAPLDADPKDGGFFHYLICHVKKGELSVDVIPAGGLTLSKVGDEWSVGNYSNFEIQARDIVVTLAAKPSKVTALADKKGKMQEMEASITSASQVGNGWEVHLSVKVAPHRKTVLKFE